MSQSSSERLSIPATSPRRWLRFVWLMVIFLSGGMIGAACGGYWMRNHITSILRQPEQLPDRILARIRSELSLSNEQLKLVEAIVRRRHAAMESLRAEAYPQQLSQFKALHSEVDAILTPEQRSHWTSFYQSVEHRYLPARPVGPPPADLIFQRFDANHDRILTEDEVPPGMWRRLRLADTNGDGKVTLKEYLDAKGNLE